MEEINTKAAVKIKTEVEYVQTLNVQLLDLQDRIKKFSKKKVRAILISQVQQNQRNGSTVEIKQQKSL